MTVRLVPGKGQWLLAPRAPRPLAWELMPEECRSQLVALGLLEPGAPVAPRDEGAPPRSTRG